MTCNACHTRTGEKQKGEVGTGEGALVIMREGENIGQVRGKCAFNPMEIIHMLKLKPGTVEKNSSSNSYPPVGIQPALIEFF